MTSQKLNKHEIKTKETRDLLLQAAETIFVRDGYEGAELGEIATLAGRTKGSIYAQFKSKEDIFLALIEEKAKRYRSQMEKMLTPSMSQEENLAAFRKFCLHLAENHAWFLLLLEFKLFALRHPEFKGRLRSFYDKVNPNNSEKKLAELFGSPRKGKNALSRSVATRTVFPLLSALAVEANFAPTLLGTPVLKKVAARIFDALLQTPPYSTI